MIIYIVMKNGKVDEVFDNEKSALEHSANILLRWNLTEIIKKEVKSL